MHPSLDLSAKRAWSNFLYFFKFKFKASYKTLAMGVLAGLPAVVSHGVKKVSFILEETNDRLHRKYSRFTLIHTID